MYKKNTELSRAPSKRNMQRLHEKKSRKIALSQERRICFNFHFMKKLGDNITGIYEMLQKMNKFYVSALDI